MDNEDDAYERYREMWGDELEDKLKNLFNDFVNIKGNYYSGNKDKFIQHSMSILNSLEVKP
jgi:hypothetical protein